MKKIIKYSAIWILLIGIISCEQPMDPVIESVQETNSILQNKIWILEDYQVLTKSADIPPPILLNANDSLIEAGNYNLADMLNSTDNIPIYKFEFTDDNTFLVDSANTGDFVDNGGTYFVFNGTQIRIKPDGIKKEIYNYSFDADNNTMTFTLTNEAASRNIDKVIQKFENYVVYETPNKIGDALGNVLTSAPVQKKIHDYLVDAIAGKISDLTDFDPETAAESLATDIMEHIESVDWQTVLSDAINTELQKIISFDPDTLAPEIAGKISEAIESEFTIDNVYNIVLPYMTQLADQDPETIAGNIAYNISNALENVFSQSNLEKIIKPIWEQFTDLTDDQVNEIASDITSLVETNWINETTLENLFISFTEQIDATSVRDLSTLAQTMTDNLEITIDNLNTKSSGLNLSPDYSIIQSGIHTILIAAKPIISSQGPDIVAQEIADLILNNFLTTETIENAFATAIHDLQDVDSDTAASTISGWIVTLEEKVSPALIEALTNKLNPILANLDPDYAAFQIAQKVNQFVDDYFNEDSLEAKILPLLQKITSVNTNAIANIIAKAIVNSPIIQDGITEENISELLYPLLEDIHNIDPENIAEQIVDTLQGKLSTVITPERISEMISFILYRKAYNNFKIVNNFHEATIVIRYE